MTEECKLTGQARVYVWAGWNRVSYDLFWSDCLPLCSTLAHLFPFLCFLLFYKWKHSPFNVQWQLLQHCWKYNLFKVNAKQVISHVVAIVWVQGVEWLGCSRCSFRCWVNEQINGHVTLREGLWELTGGCLYGLMSIQVLAFSVIQQNLMGRAGWKVRLQPIC